MQSKEAGFPISGGAAGGVVGRGEPSGTGEYDAAASQRDAHGGDGDEGTVRSGDGGAAGCGKGKSGGTAGGVSGGRGGGGGDCGDGGASSSNGDRRSRLGKQTASGIIAAPDGERSSGGRARLAGMGGFAPATRGSPESSTPPSKEGGVFSDEETDCGRALLPIGERILPPSTPLSVHTRAVSPAAIAVKDASVAFFGLSSSFTISGTSPTSAEDRPGSSRATPSASVAAQPAEAGWAWPSGASSDSRSMTSGAAALPASLSESLAHAARAPREGGCGGPCTLGGRKRGA